MGLGCLISLLSRSLILGSIVFSAVTLIPQVTVAFHNRVLVAVVVVVLYSILNYIQSFIVLLKDEICYLICGCKKPSLDLGEEF